MDSSTGLYDDSRTVYATKHGAYEHSDDRQAAFMRMQALQRLYGILNHCS